MSESSLKQSLELLIADNDGVDVSIVDTGYVQKSLDEAEKSILQQAHVEGKDVITEAEIRTSAARLPDLMGAES